MRKLILRWLFGTDDIEYYIDLLSESLNNTTEQRRLIDDHLKTLERSKENCYTILKLIKICKNHGIDVDEEIKHVQLDCNNEE